MLPYSEGTIFSIPLRSFGYAIGVVARTSSGGKIVLAYLFGPARESIPSIKEVGVVRPQAALRIERVSDFSLCAGVWPIMGLIATWKRDEWPVPDFARRDDLAKRAWLVRYSDHDIGVLVSETPYDFSKSQALARAGLLGDGGAEIVMTKILRSNQKGAGLGF